MSAKTKSSDSSIATTDTETNDKKPNEVQKHYNRDVWFVTTNSAKTKIESRTKQLEKISTEILTNPDVAHEEKEAHKYLCEVLRKLGCDVHSSYIHPTAFKAVFQSGTEGEHSNAPTVGLICEYDAVKGFGHSSGNSLSTEVTIAALIGVREAMKADKRLIGKLVIFGTPASEENGGKIRMMKEGAFDKIDVIVTTNPSHINSLFPKFYCSQKIKVNFHGISRHIDCLNTIESQNPIDAAILCYTNAMSVSNQIQPNSRIHCVIKRCGFIDYLVPKKTELVFCIRAPTLQELDYINRRIVECAEAASLATNTRAEFYFPDDDMYTYLNHNKVLANVFKEEANKLGINYTSEPISDKIIYRSTDLGNVSHKVPLINPSFCIGTSHVPIVHSQEFTEAVTKAEAQTNTIKISIAMSFTIIKYLLNPLVRQDVRKQFQTDCLELTKIANKDKTD